MTTEDTRETDGWESAVIHNAAAGYDDLPRYVTATMVRDGRRVSITVDTATVDPRTTMA